MIEAGTDVQDLLASRPSQQIVANLFTFTLISGPVYHFTDYRRPVTSGGQTYLAGPPRLVRGTIKTSRGVSIDQSTVTFQEANAEFIQMLVRGYFNRAVYRMQRVFAADMRLQWTSPVTKFVGRVDSIRDMSRTSASVIVKSMMTDLDNDYPRDALMPDCGAVLFDEACGLSASTYAVTGAAAAGTTRNTLRSALTNADGYFTQGVLTWTSGAMSGLSYMVKQYVGGVVTPSWPFLAMPAIGDTFSVTPGCDKTLATCASKFGYNPTALVAPFFRGEPFVPDPTVTY